MGRKNRQRTTSQTKGQQPEEKSQNGQQSTTEAPQVQSDVPPSQPPAEPQAQVAEPEKAQPNQEPQQQSQKEPQQQSQELPQPENVPKTSHTQAVQPLPESQTLQKPSQQQKEVQQSEPQKPSEAQQAETQQKGNQGQGNNKKGQQKKGGQQPQKGQQKQAQPLKQDLPQEENKQNLEMVSEPQVPEQLQKEVQKPQQVAVNPEKDVRHIEKSEPKVEEEVKGSGGGEGLAAPVTVAPGVVEAKPTVQAVSTNAKCTPFQSEVPTTLPPQITEPESPKCPIPDVASLPEVKKDEKFDAPVAPVCVPEVKPVTQEKPRADAGGDKANNLNATLSTEDWQKREQELLKKIEDLEKLHTKRSEDGLKLELKVRDEEIELLKARIRNLETELAAALSKPGGKNHEMIEKIKQQHEELLSKARGMIFDKTKMVKNQELQIEALTTQVQSLKDINLITRDLLEIRNSEVKAMEDRFQAMEAKFAAEKERYSLILQRAQCSTDINQDLKREYDTQLAIFKELREKYDQRVQVLVAENARLKESLHATANADASNAPPAESPTSNAPPVSNAPPASNPPPAPNAPPASDSPPASNAPNKS